MSDTANALNVGTPFTFEGREYRVKALTYEQQAQYSAWLERQAWQGVERSRPFVSHHTFQEAVAALTRDVAANVYEWDSLACQQSLQRPAGARQAIYLSLHADDHSVSMATVDRMWADKFLPELLAIIKRLNQPDPPAGATEPAPAAPSDSSTSAPSSAPSPTT